MCWIGKADWIININDIKEENGKRAKNKKKRRDKKNTEKRFAGISIEKEWKYSGKKRFENLTKKKKNEGK